MAGMFTKNAAGYSIITSPGERAIESDISKCAHCQAVIFLKPLCKPSEAPNFCMNCYQPVCDKPACQECVPFMRKVEEEERKAIRGY